MAEHQPLVPHDCTEENNPEALLVSEAHPDAFEPVAQPPPVRDRGQDPPAGVSRGAVPSVSNRELTSLSPLAILTNLTQLNLFSTQVSDLSPLASLTNLTQLNLSRTPVSDLSPLASLTNLTQLDLSDTRVSDLVPLVHLPASMILKLDHYQLRDYLKQLCQLPNLIGLNLAGQPLTDITLLADLPHLRILRLSRTLIINLAPLA